MNWQRCPSVAHNVHDVAAAETPSSNASSSNCSSPSKPSDAMGLSAQPTAIVRTAQIIRGRAATWRTFALQFPWFFIHSPRCVAVDLEPSARRTKQNRAPCLPRKPGERQCAAGAHDAPRSTRASHNRRDFSRSAPLRVAHKSDRTVRCVAEDDRNRVASVVGQHLTAGRDCGARSSVRLRAPSRTRRHPNRTRTCARRRASRRPR